MKINNWVVVYRRPMGVARGIFDREGGILEGPGGVTLTIPPGALPPNSRQEIFFTVFAPHAIDSLNETRGHRSSISPPMHNGELYISIKKTTKSLINCKKMRFYD